MLARFQDEGFLAGVLLEEGHPQKSWALNANRDAAEKESRARLAERLAAERAERERREAAEREREVREAEERAREEAERALMERRVANPKVPAVDSSGRRWFKCDVCGKVAAEGEFSGIRGWVGDVNLAVCRECE